jgi:hypothetical protein
MVVAKTANFSDSVTQISFAAMTTLKLQYYALYKTHVIRRTLLHSSAFSTTIVLALLNANGGPT